MLTTEIITACSGTNSVPILEKHDKLSEMTSMSQTSLNSAQAQRKHYGSTVRFYPVPHGEDYVKALHSHQEELPCPRIGSWHSSSPSNTSGSLPPNQQLSRVWVEPWLAAYNGTKYYKQLEEQQKINFLFQLSVLRVILVGTIPHSSIFEIFL